MLQCGPHLLDHIPESQYKESVCSMFHSTNSDDNEEGIDMKQFILSEDRVVLVKKANGVHYVAVKQKESDVKYAEFTPNR